MKLVKIIFSEKTKKVAPFSPSKAHLSRNLSIIWICSLCFIAKLTTSKNEGGIMKGDISLQVYGHLVSTNLPRSMSMKLINLAGPQNKCCSAQQTGRNSLFAIYMLAKNKLFIEALCHLFHYMVIVYS